MSITRKNSKGFTLVELIVSLALFSVVMLVSAGAYLLMINLNRQAQALAFGVNNLSFALETMVRSIRTGTDYGCKNPTGNGHCSIEAGESSFDFLDSNGNRIQYKLGTGTTFISKNIISGSGASGPITDTSLVKITALDFYTEGVNNNDDSQPYVTIVAQGTVATSPGKSQSVNVETSATMRGPDIGGL